MMKPFDYVAARSVNEAISLKTEIGDHARFLAGGTDLLALLKDGIVNPYPRVLIGLREVHDLYGIVEDGENVSIGSMVTLEDLAESACVNNRVRLLGIAARKVGTPQIRNMGTVGGNLLQEVRCWYYRYPKRLGKITCLRRGGSKCFAPLGDNRYHAIVEAKGCYAVCPSDLAVVLSVLEAKIIARSVEGTKIIPIDELYSPLGTSLKRDDVLVRVIVPVPPSEWRQAFYKLRVREAVDFAIVSVAAIWNLEDGVFQDLKLSIGGIGHRPIRLSIAECVLKGKVPTEDNIETAIKMALSDARPLSGNGYKVRVVTSLVKRVLLAGEGKYHNK